SRPDGSIGRSRLVHAVSIEQPDGLKALLGKERPITIQERNESQQLWARLRSENAAFRVVTEAGLASAPIDHFDPLLMEQATPEWQKVGHLVGYALGSGTEPFFQVGDLMLRARIVALVKNGKLVADGDPWKMSTRVRLND